ncbi:MAG: hypothetical protein K2O18_15855 [Oscillospiraceae bacterium]|nr:hypothetical protein [Oscillospiraceae bacterium]
MCNAWKKRLCAGVLALLLAGALVPAEGRAALPDVYFTAVNEQLLDMSSDTMPFWSGGVLYVSSRMFEGTDVGVNFVRNNAMGLVMLYTNRVDLRFDLEGGNAYDKNGYVYSGHAIERNGVVFFPVDLVCRYFGLTWSYTPTDTVPLVRIKSASGVLDDASFIDAAAGQMTSRYNEYERSLTPEPGPVPSVPSVPQPQPQPQPQPGEQEDPVRPIQAEEGQKVFLIIDSTTSEDTLEILQILNGVQATFVLDAALMEDGDLLRALTAGGHSIALRMTEGTAGEIEQARELVWQAACSRLELAWYEGDVDAALLEELGCVRLRATVDWRGASIRNADLEYRLLQTIGQHRQDLAVHLGGDSACASGLGMLLEDLREGQYHISPWRLNWRG